MTHDEHSDILRRTDGVRDGGTDGVTGGQTDRLSDSSQIRSQELDHFKEIMQATVECLDFSSMLCDISGCDSLSLPSCKIIFNAADCKRCTLSPLFAASLA